MTNASTDPRAVMLHSKNALATDGAVMRSGRLQPITGLAVAELDEVCQGPAHRIETKVLMNDVFADLGSCLLLLRPVIPG